MAKGRTRGPNRPSGKFVRHDWMWLWMAGSKLKDEILFKSTHGAPGATPNAKVQFFSHDNAIKTTVENVKRAAGTTDAPAYDEPYDFDAEIEAARATLGEEVKDACSVAAENLEEYRRLRQITAAQAGEAIGVNESTFRSKMRAVENMKLGEFLALCATLEVDPGVAFGFIDGEDASAVRGMHRLGDVEDHRYIGEMAEFLTNKSGTYIPRHAIIPHALADAERTISGDKTDEDDRWPRWYETDESYSDYGPYFHSEWRDDEDEYGPKISDITGYFMEADGSIFDPEQEEADARAADELMEYLTEQGFAVQRVGSNKISMGLRNEEDVDNVETESEE